MLKTIGIIGGMGPAATVDLMDKIISMTEASCDQDHIPMLVDLNTRITDRTAAILHGGESPLPEMLRSARRLEAGGADFLIMPCNTAHYFRPYIQKEIGIPLVSMLEESAKFLSKAGVDKVAVLGTDGVVQSGIYGKALGDYDIEVIYPTAEQQRLVMSVIYDYIKKGITDPEALPYEEMKSLIESLEARGAQQLLLACTELPLAFSIMGFNGENVADATGILAAAAVREAGAEVKPGTRY
ncbi:MAG: amino acid racemase [Mogibacterium sp.]|nr:amino acid racemase [Mogibacterium sp.]